jgi:hypothetical protein
MLVSASKGGFELVDEMSQGEGIDSNSMSADVGCNEGWRVRVSAGICWHAL